MTARLWSWQALLACGLNKMPKWEQQFESKLVPRDGVVMFLAPHLVRAVSAGNDENT